MCNKGQFEPFYFVNLDRFPWVDNHMYGYMEYCSTCGNTRIRIIDVKEIEVIDDRVGGTDVSADVGSEEGDWRGDELPEGADLTSPEDLVD